MPAIMGITLVIVMVASLTLGTVAFIIEYIINGGEISWEE